MYPEPADGFPDAPDDAADVPAEKAFHYRRYQQGIGGMAVGRDNVTVNSFNIGQAFAEEERETRYVFNTERVSWLGNCTEAWCRQLWRRV